MAYMLELFADEPTTRLVPDRTDDPLLERFLLEAWEQHLRLDGGRPLRRRWHEVVLHVEYELVADEVRFLFVEVVEDSMDPTFRGVLSAALRATGRLRDLPCTWSEGVRVLRRSVVFDAPHIHETGSWSFVPPPIPPTEQDQIRRAFVDMARVPVRYVAERLLEHGAHTFELDLWRDADGRSWTVHTVSGPSERAVGCLLGALVGTGQVYVRGSPEPGGVRLQLVVPGRQLRLAPPG